MIFKLAEEVLGVVWRVVVDYLRGVLQVDLIDIFSELAAGFSLDLLDLGETSTLNEGLLGFKVLGQYLGELSANIGEYVVGC